MVGEDGRIKRIWEIIDQMNSEQVDQAIALIHKIIESEINIDVKTP